MRIYWNKFLTVFGLQDKCYWQLTGTISDKFIKETSFLKHPGGKQVAKVPSDLIWRAPVDLVEMQPLAANSCTQRPHDSKYLAATPH